MQSPQSPQSLQLLPTDVIIFITRYLKLTHIHNWRRVCRHFYKQFDIKSLIIREINSRLFEIFGDKLSDFKKSLVSTGAMISGSFILQCILGERWRKSDIDIYIPIKNNDTINYNEPTPEPFNHFIYVPYPTSTIDTFMISKMSAHQPSIHLRYCNPAINMIKNFQNFSIVDDKGTTTMSFPHIIQTILLDIDKDSLEEYTKENFDFSIGKNLYYGDDQIILSNLSDIFDRVTDFKGIGLQPSSLRYYKYLKRGFAIRNKELVRDPKESIPLNLIICRGVTYDCEKIRNFYGKNLLISFSENDFEEVKNFYGLHSIPDNFPRMDGELVCKVAKINDSKPGNSHCLCAIKFFDDRIRHCHFRNKHNNYESVIIY